MICPECETIMRSQRKTSDRGVALLIVLLVTALLIALIFEFSYATRISLNNAINFRDSQRAYFLARSGIFAFINYGDKLRDIYIPQGEWGVVPLISDGDTQVIIKWEDERGKINISKIQKPSSIYNPTYDWMTQLFFYEKINQEILDTIGDNHITFQLPTELHKVMSDEDFYKIERFVTTMTPDHKINIKTASREVLEALGITQAERLISDRKQIKLEQPENIKPYFSSDQVYNSVATQLYFPSGSSDTYKVYSYATVGGYTKAIEAVVNGRSISYWRAL
jgi:hypothetical protein